MKHKPSSQAFSIVEIIVAALIFMIVAAGTFAVFSMARTTSVASDEEILAVNRGRELLESLRRLVDQDMWSSWPLTCDNALRDWPSETNVKYRCDGSVLDGSARQVTVTVGWDE